MKKIFLVSFLFMITTFVSAQIIEKYSVNIGLAYSNQNWKYKIIDDHQKKDYKLGFSFFISGEKTLNKLFALKMGFGYLQKGFIDNFEWVGVDGSINLKGNKKMVLHNMGMDFLLKLQPWEKKVSP